MKRARLRISVCAVLGVLLGSVSSANGAEVAYHFDRNAQGKGHRQGTGLFSREEAAKLVVVRKPSREAPHMVTHEPKPSHCWLVP